MNTVTIRKDLVTDSDRLELAELLDTYCDITGSMTIGGEGMEVIRRAVSIIRNEVQGNKMVVTRPSIPESYEYLDDLRW